MHSLVLIIVVVLAVCISFIGHTDYLTNTTKSNPACKNLKYSELPKYETKRFKRRGGDNGR